MTNWITYRHRLHSNRESWKEKKQWEERDNGIWREIEKTETAREYGQERETIAPRVISLSTAQTRKWAIRISDLCSPSFLSSLFFLSPFSRASCYNTRASLHEQKASSHRYPLDGHKKSRTSVPIDRIQHWETIDNDNDKIRWWAHWGVSFVRGTGLRDG